MRYAISLTVTMHQSSGLAIRSLVGVYSANSEAEAMGLCVIRAREKFPDYSISSTAIMPIEDAPQEVMEGAGKQQTTAATQNTAGIFDDCL